MKNVQLHHRGTRKTLTAGVSAQGQSARTNIGRWPRRQGLVCRWTPSRQSACAWSSLSGKQLGVWWWRGGWPLHVLAAALRVQALENSLSWSPPEHEAHGPEVLEGVVQPTLWLPVGRVAALAPAKDRDGGSGRAAAGGAGLLEAGGAPSRGLQGTKTGAGLGMKVAYRFGPRKGPVSCSLDSPEV